MENIVLSKEELLDYLINNPNDILYQGSNGIIYEKDNKLYKIYYKYFVDTYISENPDKLDDEVDSLKKVESLLSCKIYNPQNKLNEYKRLLETDSNNLITNILSYRGITVGIEMNYYKDYITLNEASKVVTNEQLLEYIERYRCLLYNLLEHDIVVKDIKWDNVLANINTNDVVLIDLDDDTTTYGPKGYIKDDSDFINVLNDKVDAMKASLLCHKTLVRKK